MIATTSLQTRTEWKSCLVFMHKFENKGTMQGAYAVWLATRYTVSPSHILTLPEESAVTAPRHDTGHGNLVGILDPVFPVFIAGSQLPSQPVEEVG